MGVTLDRLTFDVTFTEAAGDTDLGFMTIPTGWPEEGFMGLGMIYTAMPVTNAGNVGPSARSARQRQVGMA